MPPKELTAEEQRFVYYWSRKAVYIIKKMREADVYIQSIPRERYLAAYNQFTSSGQVVGGHWDNLDRRDRRRWEPKPEERDDYFRKAETMIENNPPTSPLKAVATLFAGNSALMVINRLVAEESPERVHRQYRREFNKYNKEHFLAVYGPPESRPGRTKDAIVRDPEENPSNEPFVRPLTYPRDPANQITPDNWKQFERIGETYFFKNADDTTGFSAFQLTGIIMLTTGTSYKIRFEETVDSINMAEKEFFKLVKDGLWF